MEKSIPRVSTLYSGTGQPYVALFTENLDPLLNTVNGLPLGYYISKFDYQMNHEKENVCNISIDAGITEILDIPEVQEGNVIKMQYGYVFSDGSVKSSKLYTLKIKEVSITLDDKGTHIGLALKDSVSDLRHIDGYMESGDDKTFIDYLDEGLYVNTGIKIVQFNQGIQVNE